MTDASTTGRLAVYPGAFDPPTLGHLDVIERGLAVFDRLVVAVARNPSKTPLFDPEQRIELLRRSLDGADRVTVTGFEGLTVDFCREHEATAILRGIRTMTDFEYESHLALTNRSMTGIETVFVIASQQYSFISSSLIREIARYGGDVSPMVPPPVQAALREKFG